MPRITAIDDATLSMLLPESDLGAATDALAEPTWQRVMAHRPTQLRGLLALMETFRSDSIVDRRLIEIAVVTVSRLNECQHCVGRHSLRLMHTGLTPEVLQRLLEPNCPLLSPVELLVRDYAREVSEKSATMRDLIFARLKQHFTDAQIVELTLRITLAGFFNRFNNALQVDLDDGHASALRALGGIA